MRHTKILVGETVNGDDEAGSGLAKNVNDVVSGKTFVGMAAVQRGQHAAVVIVYDD